MGNLRCSKPQCRKNPTVRTRRRLPESTFRFIEQWWCLLHVPSIGHTVFVEVPKQKVSEPSATPVA